MVNRYLHIEVLDNGHIRVNSSDGVFSSIATLNNEEAFYEYCDDKAEEWLTSKLGNYEEWTKADRKEVANKWLKVKELSEGEYPCYFNLGNIHDIFKQEVAEIAKTLGIENYTLEIKSI